MHTKYRCIPIVELSMSCKRASDSLQLTIELPKNKFTDGLLNGEEVNPAIHSNYATLEISANKIVL